MAAREESRSQGLAASIQQLICQIKSPSGNNGVLRKDGTENNGVGCFRTFMSIANNVPGDHIIIHKVYVALPRSDCVAWHHVVLMRI